MLFAHFEITDKYGVRIPRGSTHSSRLQIFVYLCFIITVIFICFVIAHVEITKNVGLVVFLYLRISYARRIFFVVLLFFVFASYYFLNSLNYASL